MQQLTKEQGIILTGFTGLMCVNSFSDFHADVEKRLGRPVWTHQFPELQDEIKEAYRADFNAMLPSPAPLTNEGDTAQGGGNG